MLRELLREIPLIENVVQRRKHKQTKSSTEIVFCSELLFLIDIQHIQFYILNFVLPSPCRVNDKKILTTHFATEETL